MEDPPASSLDLAPDPGAVRVARDWVGRVLGGWPDERVETARLLVSELVTNAVLHARTQMALRFLRDGERARFEVGDGLRAGPVAKRYAASSPTGRGIRLVAALADGWGVTRSKAGKVVWFEMEPSECTGPAEVGSALHVDLEGLFSRPEPADEGRSVTEQRAQGPRAPGTAGPAGEAATENVDVQFLGLPLDVYLEVEEHNDAVMRELELITQSSLGPSSVDVPRRLVELAGQASAAFAPAATRLRSEVDGAIARGDATIDLRMGVPRIGWEALLRVAEQLDELDRFCEEGDLLTLASPPRLRRLRAWFAQQVSAQMRGEPATEWSEGDDAQAGEARGSAGR